ncbi:MAG: methionine ABC transporter ATP-binding protein [Clostridia bacterium]|nr:methionine ABC transporter ATP-binding protein [Clostridia bacterium]
MNEIIHIEHLKKSFGELTVLSDVNLSIFEGEIFGVIGLSGAGKSTLVRCINGLEKPSGGRVLVGGCELSTLPKRELLAARRKIGMIFQQFNLFEQRTVQKNVRFPFELEGMSRSEANERSKRLLELVGLSDKLHAYPSKLSGGQKQRVAIARALASNPHILLCDEATSALDPQTTEQILSLLKQINRNLNITIVIITHEMSLVEKICDRVAIIDGGHIAETGLVRDIFLNPRTEAAQKLVMKQPSANIASPLSKSCLRLVFDGVQAQEPVVAGMILACGAPVSILFADAKTVAGKTYGQMLIQLPDDGRASELAKRYLSQNGVRWSEEATA